MADCLCTPITSVIFTDTGVTAITFGNIGCSDSVFYTIYPTYFSCKNIEINMIVVLNMFNEKLV